MTRAAAPASRTRLHAAQPLARGPPIDAVTPYRATLRVYLGPQWPKALALGATMLADISLDLWGPQVQRRFIDGAMAGAPLGDLLGTAGLFLGIAVVTQGLFVVSNYVATDIAQVGTNRLRADLLDHVLRLDLGFHNAHPPGALIERIDGDVALLGNFLSRFLLELVGSALLLAGALVLLFGIDARIGGTLTAFAVASFAVMRAMLGASTKRMEADRAASADLYGFLEERLAGTEDIRANGATAYVMRRFFERARALARKRVVAYLFGAGTYNAAVFLLATGTALALALGALLYREGTITLGTVYLILMYSLLLDGPIQGIARQMQDLQQAGAAIRRVGQLLTTRPEVRDPETPGALPPGPLGVSFDAVSFAYRDVPPEASGGEAGGGGMDGAGGPEGAGGVEGAGGSDSTGPAAPVLHGVTFDLAPGRSLGLLGRTGSGKTTLTRLLFRLVDPTAGAVRLGGVDLRGVALADLRRGVALVTQDVQLFHGSVRDNLTFFDGAVDDGRLRDAVEAVGLGGWLDGLPEGLDTVLPPGGGLSAGQAQLLALARVFLRDPGVVVLDEASSRLDPSTEARLERALDRLLAGRTVIVIAHRLATVRRVDDILILSGGAVVEHGPRAALVADPETRFARLLRAGEEMVEGPAGSSGMVEDLLDGPAEPDPRDLGAPPRRAEVIPGSSDRASSRTGDGG